GPRSAGSIAEMAGAEAPLRVVATAHAEPSMSSTPAPTASAPAISAIEPALRGPSPAPADPQPAGNQVVMAELQAMRQLMEERFNTLSWLGQARQDPVHSNLMLKLVRAGYSPGFARTVLEPIAIGPDAAGAVREVMAGLERQLAIDPATPSLVAEGGVFALVGATGVGKTTTAAKLAAQCARLHGAASVGLVTLDTQRAGAHEQLRASARSLGVVAHLAHDRAALQELLLLFKGKKMVLIDTAGFAPRDPRRRDLLDLLEMPSVKRVMVLNAGAHGDTLDDMAACFKVGGTRSAILSKVDEAVKIAPALDTLVRHKLVLRGLCNGPRVPQDWK
ncbi:MAG: flagellar biosynthesis protein FlhF, partial [Comamonadaceae bacterium]